MLVCLMSLRTVSICLLLHKATNNFTCPIGNNSAFSKGHLQILSRQISHEAQIIIAEKRLKRIVMESIIARYGSCSNA